MTGLAGEFFYIFSFLAKKFRSFSVFFSLRDVEADKFGSGDEMELVRRISGGDSECFDILVRRYSDMIFRLCCSMMNDFDEGDDCAQETFIRAYRKIHTFEGRSSLSTWLYRIAVNTCRNRLTSSHMRRRAGSGHEIVESLGDSSPGPEEEFERKSGEEKIRHAVSLLPEEERVLVVLRDFENRPYDEIARITGIKQGTVKSRLARARHRLRDLLKGVEI